MNKAVMISIQPKWCELIASGKKTIEVRKTKPKIETPFKSYVYAIKSKRDEIGRVTSYSFRSGIRFEVGKVIGEFICDRVYDIQNKGSCFMVNDDKALTNRIGDDSCLDFTKMRNYLGGKDDYAWHISSLIIYDKPKELREFYSYKVCKDYWDGNSGCDDVCGVSENNACYCGHVALHKPPQSFSYVEEIKA